MGLSKVEKEKSMGFAKEGRDVEVLLACDFGHGFVGEERGHRRGDPISDCSGGTSDSVVKVRGKRDFK